MEQDLTTSSQTTPAAPSANGGFAEVIESGILAPDELRAMPIGTRVMFCEPLLRRFYGIAKNMAESDLCPDHLRGNVDACFSVVRMALNWNMDWFQVAASTYSPAKGKIGIEGRLAVGAMLGSGKVKEIKYAYTGDWSRVNGKFKMVPVLWDGKPKMKAGKPVMRPEATYSVEDEQGLGIVATAVMHDGREVSTPEILLAECHPRNSAQWHNSPRRQIINVASRALAQIAAADVMMGVQFDDGIGETELPREPVDVTPPAAPDIEPVEPVDVEMEGEGESEPGTPSGFVTPKPRKRISLEYRGKMMSQTNFVRDVRQQVKMAVKGKDTEDFQDIVDDVMDAVDELPTDDRLAIMGKIEPVLKQAEEKLGTGIDIVYSPQIDDDNLEIIEEEFVNPDTGEVSTREELDLA